MIRWWQNRLRGLSRGSDATQIVELTFWRAGNSVFLVHRVVPFSNKFAPTGFVDYPNPEPRRESVGPNLFGKASCQAQAMKDVKPIPNKFGPTEIYGATAYGNTGNKNRAITGR